MSVTLLRDHSPPNDMARHVTALNGVGVGEMPRRWTDGVRCQGTPTGSAPPSNSVFHIPRILDFSYAQIWGVLKTVPRDPPFSAPDGHRALKSVGNRGQSVRRDGRRGGAFMCDTVPRVAPPRAVFPAPVFVQRAPPPHACRRSTPRVAHPRIAPLPRGRRQTATKMR